jgi:hypothetical protein
MNSRSQITGGGPFCRMAAQGSEIERSSFNGQASPNNRNVLNFQAGHGIRVQSGDEVALGSQPKVALQTNTYQCRNETVTVA